MADTKKKMIHVTEVRSVGDTSLVEWIEGNSSHRVSIPHAEIVDGKVDSETLTLGVPYGIPWEDVVQLKASTRDLADRLRNAGIWTTADVIAHSREIYGIVQAVYGVDVGAILMAANQFEEVKHG